MPVTPCRPKWKGTMTDRERFNNQMHYKPVDRCFNMEFGYWDENYTQWDIFVKNGIKNEGDANVFFSAWKRAATAAAEYCGVVRSSKARGWLVFQSKTKNPAVASGVFLSILLKPYILRLARIASRRMATMLMILIIGLTAGPAVSLYGSPTVSPVTAALCASERLRC